MAKNDYAQNQSKNNADSAQKNQSKNGTKKIPKQETARTAASSKESVRKDPAWRRVFLRRKGDGAFASGSV